MLGRSGSPAQLPALGQLGAPRRGGQRGAMVTLSEPVPPGLAAAAAYVFSDSELARFFF